MSMRPDPAMRPQGQRPRLTVLRRPAPIALLAAALMLMQPATSAQPPEVWLLDHFEVVHTEDVHDEVETRRFTAAGGSLPEFKWGGTKIYTGEYPTGKLITTATLKVELPDKITPGVPFQVGGGATGQVATPGRTGLTAATLVAYDECYVRAVCPGALKSQYLDDISGKTVDLAAPLASVSAVLPTDPQSWPPVHVVMFRGTIGTTTPGDPVWRVYVYAHYKRPEIVPTAVPSYRLEVDADTTRLPPSGAVPAEATVTATMVDGAGKPLAGEALQFALDPPDMGSLAATAGVTDAAGEVRVRYRAPQADALRGRTEVAVVVKSAARSLERRLVLRIERYQLALTVDPAELPVEPVWRAIRVTATVRDFDGRPVAGDLLQFRVDPADMGSFLGATMNGNKASTDASGRVEAFYEPLPAGQLQGRDRATVYVTNLTHGGEVGAAVRFLGLKVIRTWPDADARDIDLEPGDTIDLEFDRPLDAATVTNHSVKVETLWHGDLGADVTTFGRTAQIHLRADPIPDVGLRVHVTVAGGPEGVRGRDGSLLLGPHELRFRTMPRFDPKIIVSQVVDNPRDPLYGFITLAVKTFVLRVEAGISEDSELDDEPVAVRLMIPRRGMDLSQQHTFYPGRWPPKVPQAATKKGNTANFVVPAPFGRGGYTFDAELRPLYAVPEKVISVPPVAANVNSWSDVGAARKIGLLAVPIVNDQIPGFEWKVSRGQQESWLLGLGQPAANLMPLTRLDLRLGYLAETTCIDPEKCVGTQPWTSFLEWAKDLGRTGFATRMFGWRYMVALVPPGYFDRYADHPDFLANPGDYHDAIQSGIWSQRASGPDSRIGQAAFPVSLMEVGTSPEALVHILGDIEGLADSTAERDDLSGYDLLNDRVIYSDAEHTIGASRAVMNLGVGFGSTWPATRDYEAFIGEWTERSCLGAPPCPPRFLAAPSPSQNRPDARLSAASPVPVVLVSGTLRRRANGSESATIDPLIASDGVPSLEAAGTGDHSLELRDASGARLARYPFTPAFGTVSDGSLAGFLLAVPADPAAESIALLNGDSLVAQRQRSAHPPTVSFTQPSAGRTLRGDVEVAWTGADVDDDALSYSLLFSGDGGLRWEPLLMDSRATRHTLPSALVGNGPDARLRVVAMDGFDTSTATLSFGLDNPPTVLALAPEDGAKGVPVRTTVQLRLRDPLDPTSVDGASLTLQAIAGVGAAGVGSDVLIAGDVGYELLDRTLVFTPTAQLAEATTYEARLSSYVHTPDGRRLPADTTWTFTTRGQTAYLPWLVRSGNLPSRTATPRPTRTPGGPTPTLRPTQSRTPTPDDIGTRVAATLTALAPTATRAASPTPSMTPDELATAVAATLTALAPTPGTPGTERTATPSPTLSATATQSVGELTALAATTTGADANLMRMAFAPGEVLTLWLKVNNSGPGMLRGAFDFAVSNASDARIPGLSWLGEIDVAVGASWFKLERTVPANLPPGPYTFTGRVRAAGSTSAWTAASSELYLTASLQLADDFSSTSSGWQGGQDSNGSFGYFDGGFRFLFTTANSWRWARSQSSPTLSDLALEADVRMPTTARGAAALVFALNPATSDFHLFEIDSAGRYSIWRHTASGWETLLSPTSSPLLGTGDVTNHLLLVRESGLTRLYANGQAISMVTDLPAPAGRVGIYASSVDAGFEARWDNFRVYGLR
jgi:hypothetical protein